MNKSCTKRKSDQEDLDNKRVKSDVNKSRIGIFNDKSIRKMINDKQVVEGKPFTFYYGKGTISCIIWIEQDETKITNLFYTIEKYPEIFTKQIASRIDKDISWFIFNQGSAHFPLQLAIKDLYNNSSSYHPLRKIKSTDDTNHNLFKIFKLLDALCSFLLFIEEKGFPLPIFDYGLNIVNISKILMDNMWIKYGNIRKANIFEKDEIIISPFLLNEDVKEVETIKKDLIFKVFKEIGKKIFNLKTHIDVDLKFFSIDPFKNIESIIRFFANGPRNKIKIFDSISQVKEAIENVLEWFQANQHWPQIVWNDIWSQHYIKDERCMIIDCYNDKDVKDLIFKLNLTGSAWWPKPQENEIFSNRPFLIMFSWKNDKLYCRIAFDHLVHLTSGNIITETFKLNSMENINLRNYIIKNIPEAFSIYCKEIYLLHEKGIVLPKKTILERTVFYYDAIAKKTKFKLCMYNTVTSSKMKSSSIYCSSFHKVHNTLYTLLDLYKNVDEKQNSWEFGITLISLYKHLIRGNKIGIEKERKLSNFINEYQLKNAQRIWIFPYKGGWVFSLLIAFILVRDSENIPTLKQIYNSKFMKKWILSGDLSDFHLQNHYDQIYSIFQGEEFREFEYMMVNMNRPNLFEDSIILDSKWRNVKIIEHAQGIIKSFTHSLKFPIFNCVMMRNRHKIPLSFSMEEDKYQELGEGRGVFQEGLTLYWMSLLETGLFNINSKRNILTDTNLNSNHWFVLGLLLGHASLNNFSFFIDQPMVFFKVYY